MYFLVKFDFVEDDEQNGGLVKFIFDSLKFPYLIAVFFPAEVELNQIRNFIVRHSRTLRKIDFS